jgi:hypothetical protein
VWIAVEVAALPVALFVTGEEEGTPEKLRKLLAEVWRPPIVAQRPQVRIEAEYFTFFDGYVREHRNNDRETSHRISVVRPQPNKSGRIRTRLDYVQLDARNPAPPQRRRVGRIADRRRGGCAR